MSIFNQVSVKKPSSNTFDLSHDRKFSATIGELTPILVQETVPGDKFNINSSQMLRFAPMVAPIMHKASVYTHFFLYQTEFYGIIGKNLYQEVKTVTRTQHFHI